jgi:hypothetical protein
MDKNVKEHFTGCLLGGVAGDTLGCPVEFASISNKRNALVAEIKRKMSILENLLSAVRNEWIYEDRIYRFYHFSYKVYDLQESTKEIVAALHSLSLERKLNSMFMTIIEEGTGKFLAVRIISTGWNQLAQ